MASSTVNYGLACMLKHHGRMRLARSLVDHTSNRSSPHGETKLEQNRRCPDCACPRMPITKLKQNWNKIGTKLRDD